jgi:hypothetical protein
VQARHQLGHELAAVVERADADAAVVQQVQQALIRHVAVSLLQREVDGAADVLALLLNALGERIRDGCRLARRQVRFQHHVLGDVRAQLIQRPVSVKAAQHLPRLEPPPVFATRAAGDEAGS